MNGTEVEEAQLNALLFPTAVGQVLNVNQTQKTDSPKDKGLWRDSNQFQNGWSIKVTQTINANRIISNIRWFDLFFDFHFTIDTRVLHFSSMADGIVFWRDFVIITESTQTLRRPDNQHRSIALFLSNSIDSNHFFTISTIFSSV